MNYISTTFDRCLYYCEKFFYNDIKKSSKQEGDRKTGRGSTKRPRSGRSTLQKPSGISEGTRVATLASVSDTSDKASSIRTTRSARVESPADRLSQPLDTPRTTAFGTLPASTTSTGVDTGAMPQTTEDQVAWAPS